MWYFKINLEVPRGEGLRNGKKNRSNEGDRYVEVLVGYLSLRVTGLFLEP